MQSNQSDNIPPFADRFAKMIFTRYPEWEQYRVDPDMRWQVEDDLAIEVPSRLSPKCPLRIETIDEMIIISWVGWHEHFYDWGGTYMEDKFISRAFEIIDKILVDKYVVAIAWKDDRILAAEIFRSDAINKKLHKGFWAKAVEDEQVVAISWNGNYDRGQFDPAKCW